MEKVMSSEERIRRAEEIYNRRRERYNGNIRVSSSSVNVNSKPEYIMLKKLILQVLICLLIYFIFYIIKNSNYIFSADVLQKTQEFLSYDINFQNVYETVNTYYNNTKEWLVNLDEDKTNENRDENQQNNKQEEQKAQDSENIEEQSKDNEENVIKQENVNPDNTDQTAKLDGIGGGTDNNEEIQGDKQNEEVELSQMEIDANEIKQNYSFIVPLKGTITSRYGPREATQIISGNHKGIDIAVNEGTVFCAAMEGTVIDVSTEGSYGNHIYVQNGDVVTLYAHCKTIYLQNGQIVTQGMPIGEVGSTGNATGPHLHFEIRKSERVVNPEYILDF